MALLTFDAAIVGVGSVVKTVLLGNGFSMAYSSELFSYSGLFDRAIEEEGCENLKRVFESIGTRDFEIVMSVLKSTCKIGEIYKCASDLVEEMAQDAEDLKDILVDSISSTHPENCSHVTEAQYKSTQRFLSNFSAYYTTNYDLLLYWALLRGKEYGITVNMTDGFYRDDGILIWDNANKQASYYLHGALHLYKESHDIKKLSYSEHDIPLKDQVRTNIGNGLFPIFVSEGTVDEKIERIEQNKYLRHCLESFSGIGGALFVHGHSFSDNDAHIWDAIRSNDSMTALCISIYGDENSRINQKIMQTANSLTKKGNVYFYDASTARLWEKAAS